MPLKNKLDRLKHVYCEGFKIVAPGQKVHKGFKACMGILFDLADSNFAEERANIKRTKIWVLDKRPQMVEAYQENSQTYADGCMGVSNDSESTDCIRREESVSGLALDVVLDETFEKQLADWRGRQVITNQKNHKGKNPKLTVTVALISSEGVLVLMNQHQKVDKEE